MEWNGRRFFHIPYWQFSSIPFPFHTKNLPFHSILKFSSIFHSILPNPQVGTNNNISKAQRNKAQRPFQPVKVQRKMRNLIFLLSEAQRNFRNELFDSVKAQRNSAIAERHFRAKLKRNLTSAIEISQHNPNSAFFAVLD